MRRKIRVLNVLPFGGIGGAEKYVLSLCRFHDRNRFDVRVTILFSGGPVSDQIAGEGVEVKIIGMRNGFDLIRAMDLIGIIRRSKIDIVNIHGQNPLGKVCSILARPEAIVHTDHGTTMNSLTPRKGRVVLTNRLITPYIDRFIAISLGMKRSLLGREKIPHHKITLMYNGVDVKSMSAVPCQRDDLREALKITPGIAVLGTIGRLVPEKQYPQLFQALSRLKSKGGQFIFLLVGDGPENQPLHTLADQLGLGNCLRFLGWQNDVIGFLELMDVFLFASAGEAFSITILEAMARSKPIVAFDVDGVNEAVVDNRTGFLVPFGDTHGLAVKTKILIDTPQLAAKFGAAAFQRVSTHFNLETNIRQLEVLYDELLQEKGNTLY